MLKNYHLHFEFWGLALFLAMMIPTLIWSVIPAPNDILRTEDAAGAFDMAVSLLRLWMIAALCILRNRKAGEPRLNALTIAAAACCLLYFTGWIFYYIGAAGPTVILGLTLPPCLAFLLFAIDRKNGIALLPALAFTACHLFSSLQK